MLQYTTIHPATLELLKLLMQEECLQHFNLVGGTALALQMGHRISVDLDLFSSQDFDNKYIISELSKKFKSIEITEHPFTIIQKIEYPFDSQNYIKVDIVKYPYKLLNQPIFTNGIRLLTKEDIIPMKLSAIGSRGSKKDFYDIFFLLKEFDIKHMFSLFEQKFPNVNYFHIVKSLSYFDDADKELNPKTIEKIAWNDIKKEIQKQVKKMV